MLKPFDKAFDTAPFLQDKILSDNIQKKIYYSLIILALGAVINFGYIFLVHLSISFVISNIIVWTVQFFHKSLFFNTIQWKITVLAYTLCLSPNISIYGNILGILFLFIIGVKALTIDQRSIINPIFIGILIANLLNINFANSDSIPLLNLTGILQNLNPNQSLFKLFIDSNNIIAGQFSLVDPSIVMQLSSLSLADIENITIPFLFSSQITWFGTGSPALLIVVFIYLVITKSIYPIPNLIYITISLVLLFSQQQLTSVLSPVLPMVLFSGIFFINMSSMPHNKMGMSIFAIVTALLFMLLSLRQSITINYIFTFTIANILSPLIEYISKPSVFGIDKKKFAFTSGYRDFHKLRLVIGIILFIITIISAKYLFQTPILDRPEEARLRMIQNLYPTEIIQSSNDTMVYTFLDSQSRYIVYSRASVYRSTVDILVEILDDEIQDIKIISLKTAHTYYNNNFEWLQGMNNMSMITLSEELQQKQDTIFVNYRDSLIVKTFIQALKNSQTTYTNFQQQKEGE